MNSLVEKFGKKPVLNLIYRGGRDGWSAFNDFHRLCDGKGPTLTLIQVENGRICGGYTSVSWSSPINAGSKHDNDAYLFSVDSKSVFHNNKKTG